MELQFIQKKIYEIRGCQIMSDFDLAELYSIETKVLKRTVRRNMDRFPPDFMIELTAEGFENLRCQFGTSSWGGTRYLSCAFTQEGVTILSSVLRTPSAV